MTNSDDDLDKVGIPVFGCLFGIVSFLFILTGLSDMENLFGFVIGGSISLSILILIEWLVYRNEEDKSLLFGSWCSISALILFVGICIIFVSDLLFDGLVYIGFGLSIAIIMGVILYKDSKTRVKVLASKQVDD